MVRTRIAAGRLFAAALFAILLCVASVVGAFAETVAAVAPIGSTIDLSPVLAAFVDIALVVFGPALAIGASGILLRLYRLAGVKVTAAREKALRDKVDQALGHAAAFARARTGAIGPVRIDVGHPAIAIGAEYAIEAIPGALKELGIVDAASERLKNMVEARLGAGASAGIPAV